MQLGKALIGAVIGSAVGVGVLVAAYFLFGTDSAAMALVVAVAAGLGVRAMVATKGHASYLRGALTGLLAIAAFVGGKFLVVDLATRQIVADAQRPAAAAAEDTAGEATNRPADAAPAVDMPQPDERRAVRGTPAGGVRVRQGFSTWDFIWISIAALIAYELGRGSETAAPSTSAAENAGATGPPKV